MPIESKAAYGTRTDCVRDNRRIECRGSTPFGFSTSNAKRGSWIIWERENVKRAGRVVGGVTCEGKRWIEVIAVGEAFNHAHVQWIDAAWVRYCYPSPHFEVLEFLTGDWSDPDKILRTAARGHVCEFWLSGKRTRDPVAPDAGVVMTSYRLRLGTGAWSDPFTIELRRVADLWQWRSSDCPGLQDWHTGLATATKDQALRRAHKAIVRVWLDVVRSATP